MMTFSSLLVTAVMMPLALIASVLFMEIAAGFLTRRKSVSLVLDAARPSIAVLVPAHNESRGLLPTLADISSQLRADDRLVVVADNCSDDTAEVAAAAGAEVVKRSDLESVGKGYALDFGLRYLKGDVPDVVILVDADCRLDALAIDRLARCCIETGRPVQGLYLMNAPEGSGIGRRVAEFAWRVKNSLRPRGLAALRLPCQLMGSGMAFPRDVICSANLATGHLAEDLHLGLQLTSNWHPPIFCPTAIVRSEFPATAEAAATQRNRWEQGHLRIILTEVLPFIWKSVVTGNWRLLFLSLDAAVPPLTLLGSLIVGMLMISCVIWLLFGWIAPVILSWATLTLLSACLFMAWSRCGSDVLPARALLSAVPYALGKLPAYARMFSSSESAKWVRTDRSKPD